MSRIGHIFKELGRNLRRHPGTAVGSLMSLTLLFLLFDLFWIAAGTSERFYNHLLADLRMEVFLLEEAETDSTTLLFNRSLESIEGLRSAEFTSSEEARRQLSRMIGTDLLTGYDTTNPLPCSFVLSFHPEYLNTTDMARIEGELAEIPGVDQVFYSRRWLSKAEKTKTVILNIGMVLGGLVLLTALMNSANNVQLMTQNRAVGFRQMRILGAGRLFLAFPFLLEGFLISGVSATTGWLLVLYAHRRVTFTQFDIVMPSLEEIAIFCSAVGVLGLVSGYVGIRRMLK